MEGCHPAGGSLSLAELLDEHGEKVFFDLHHYAGGLNLIQALREGSGYTPKDIIILILNLPVESATMAAIRGGDQFRGWGIDRYMVANLIDSVRENTYVLAAANSKRKPPEPKPMFRPEHQRKDKSQPNSFASMAAAFYNAAQRKES